MIALPWLVLLLTGNALAVGTVVATAGIPRALFMLVGGALTDRITPRKLMINSNLVRMILTGLLAGLALMNLIQLWMLYAFALVFGLADAFFFPAQTSIVPQLVEKDQHLQHSALLFALVYETDSLWCQTFRDELQPPRLVIGTINDRSNFVRKYSAGEKS